MDSFVELQEYIQEINKNYKALNVESIREIQRTIEPTRKRLQKLVENNEIARGSAQIQEILRANKHTQSLIKNHTKLSQLPDVNIHPSWLKLNYDIATNLRSYSKLIVQENSLWLIGIERLQAKINFEALKNQYKISQPTLSEMNRALGDTSSSFRELLESFQSTSDILKFPEFTLTGATREIYTTNYALKSLDNQSTEEETDAQFFSAIKNDLPDCVDLLNLIDPTLTVSFIEAQDALYGGNSVHARHILVSLRELLNHLLRALAPNEDVLLWISQQPEQSMLLHNQSPTRRAKLLYIYRDLHSKPFMNFLRADTNSFLKLFDIFNTLHEKNPQLTNQQLEAIFIRTKSWIAYLIHTSRENRNS